MSEAALIDFVERLLAGNYDPVSAIVEVERASGFEVVRPGDKPWFRAADWRHASVASIDGSKARLILLHAFESGAGSFRRALDGIKLAGLSPVVVEPTPEFAQALKRMGWKHRTTGRSFDDRETIWYPTPAKKEPRP